MNDEGLEFRAAVEARVEVNALDVTGDLLGQSHAFMHEGLPVTVSLPAYTGEDTPGSYERYSWYPDDQSNLAFAEYSVGYVLISIDIAKPLTAPQVVLEKPPKQTEALGPLGAAEFDAILAKHKPLLKSAMGQWLSVLRWSTRIFDIGASNTDRSYIDSLQCVLVRREDRKRVWPETITMIVSGNPVVGISSWRATEQALKHRKSPPLWFAYLTECQHRIIAEDYNGAVLSLAIACETVMRTLLWELSGKPSNPVAALLIERANAQTIIGHLQSLLGLSKAELKLWPKSAIHELFDIRNKLIHEGSSGTITKELAYKMRRQVVEFIELANVKYCSIVQLADPFQSTYKDDARSRRLAQLPESA